MRELLRKEPALSPRGVLEMVTVNAARAIGQTHSLGRISRGFHADMIAIPSSKTGDRVFDAISAFEGPVPWMMVNGRELGIG